MASSGIAEPSQPASDPQLLPSIKTVTPYFSPQQKPSKKKSKKNQVSLETMQSA